MRARDAVHALMDVTLGLRARLIAGARQAGGRRGARRRGAARRRPSHLGLRGMACGDLPGLVDLRVTRQDLFHFGKDASWSCPPIPGWVEYDAAVYGTGDVDGHGVKVAPDREGPEFDPDADERVASPDNEQLRVRTSPKGSRGSPARRSWGRGPCPYALTPDTHFVIAPHPEHERVWILGGGSGMGSSTARARRVRRAAARRSEPDERFGLGERVPAMKLRTAGGRL